MATKGEIQAIVDRPWSFDFEYGDGPDEGILAYVVEWPDCFAAGRTRTEALVALDKAMRGLAEYRLDTGLEIPDPIGAFSGRLALRLPKALHHDAAIRATEDGVSLNTWISSAVARELGPARRTVAAGSGRSERSNHAAGSSRRKAAKRRKAS
jgi:predicted RNase H-like HicB family nuclease